MQRRRLPVPVISIGNLVVGGTGKTPFAMWLVRFLASRGIRPAVLTRGYGRKSNDHFQVPARGPTAIEASRAGDEAVLMARRMPDVPVWVGRNRSVSGHCAIKSCRVQALVLDDGFQHLMLERDLDLVLLDAHHPFGNGSLLPLGPLREPIDHLNRADAIVLTRAEDAARLQKTRWELAHRFPHVPLFACRHRFAGLRIGLDGPRISPKTLRGRRCTAFAGIARPDAFFEGLRSQGIHLARCIAFPDHHSYRPSDISLVLRDIQRHGTHFLISTEKDAVRLPAWLQSLLLIAELEIDFGPDGNAFSRYLDAHLSLF